MGGHKSQPSTPKFQTGIASFGDGSSSKTYANGDTVQSDYTPSSWESGNRNWTQNQISQNADGVNVFDSNTQNELKQMANAKRNQAVQDFQDTYTPVLQSNLESISRRFGGLNSSSLDNAVNTYSKNTAKAISNINDDYQSNLQNLENNELSRRYNYLNYLNGNLDYLDNKANNAINDSNKDSSLGNSYKESVYNTEAGMYNNKQSNNARKYAANMQFLGKAVSAAALL